MVYKSLLQEPYPGARVVFWDSSLTVAVSTACTAKTVQC